MDLSTAMESLIATSIGTTMVSLGLGLQVSALREWCERPWLPLRVLVGSCVVVPLAGLLLLHAPWSGSIARPVRQAIALMAICPSAPLALRKARGLGGDQQLAALVQMGGALLAIISIPLLGALYRLRFGVDGWDVLPRHVALQVSRIQVLPLLVGVGLRFLWPQLADRVSSPLNKLAHGLLLLMLVVVVAIAAPLLWEFLPGNWLALLTMVVLAGLAVWIGSALAGPASQQGRTAAVVTAMRNPGLALLFATEHSSDLRPTTAAILVYVLVTLALLQIVLKPEPPAGN